MDLAKLPCVFYNLKFVTPAIFIFVKVAIPLPCGINQALSRALHIDTLFILQGSIVATHLTRLPSEIH
jgi:hypothetical protein